MNRKNPPAIRNVGLIAAAILLVTMSMLVASSPAADAPAGPSDALVDAKRRAANDLLRQNKTTEGVALLREVVAIDGKNFKDHLALARAFDKLNSSASALESYRKVLALVPADTKVAEERTARTEADRRVKLLDQQSAKIDLAVDDFGRKLLALEREAESSKSGGSLTRIYRLRAALIQADGKAERGACEVQATAGWTQSRFTVLKGRSYRVVAKGVWRMGNKAGDECTADGVSNGRALNGKPVGCIVAAVEGVRETEQFLAIVSREQSFIAPATGQLMLNTWEDASEKPDNSGSMFVFIEESK